MKISAINTNQSYQSIKKQYQLKNNFKGNIIVPERLSAAGELLFKKVEKPLVAIVGKMPFDILVREAAATTKDMKPVIALIEPQKKNAENVIQLLIEDNNDKFLSQINIEEMQETFANLIEKSKETPIQVSNKKPPVKHYVPISIGKVQKPYITRPFNHQVKK